MKKYLVLSLLALTACGDFESILGGSRATSVQPTPPANLPGPNYDSVQFTDNRGCNYIRTEYEGVVNWVPRVTLSGSHICGGAQGTQFAVGQGIDDPHGTLTAQVKPTVPTPEPTQVASLPPAAPTTASVETKEPANLLEALFGSANASADEESVIQFVETGEPDGSVTVQFVNPSDAPQAPAATPQPIVEPTPAPVSEPQTIEPAPASVPVPQIVEAPAPVVEPTQAPAPAVPTSPMPAPGSGNVMVVFIGNQRAPASPEIINALKADGYRLVERVTPNRRSVFVIPKEGENPMALRQDIIKRGATYTLVAGVQF